MKEFLSVIQDWKNNGKRLAIARVIKTWGSSPRPIGSTMLIAEDEAMAGSVSGGCVEGSVIMKAKELLNNNQTQELQFGVTDETAWSVGLSCGGKIEVFLQPFFGQSQQQDQLALWEKLHENLNQNKGCILVTKLQEGASKNTLIQPNENEVGSPVPGSVKEKALEAYDQRITKIVEEPSGDRWFVQVFPRRHQMLVIGAAHITADLIHFAKGFDFEVTVIDPRGTFATKTHFQTPPDEIIEQYPSEVLDRFTLDAYTYAVVLSHDPKIDDNALEILLPSKVAYIGALGSKRTHAKRVARLEDKGFSTEQIESIHAPIGMNINAKTPKEIALSIIGEVVRIKNQFR